MVYVALGMSIVRIRCILRISVGRVQKLLIHTIYNPDEKVQVLQSLTGAANSASSDGSGSSSLMVFCQRKVRLKEGPHIT